MRKEMHGDHAFGIAFPPFHVAKMPEQRRRVIALVDDLGLEAVGQQGITTGRVDDETRQPDASRTVGIERRHFGVSAWHERNVGDAHPLKHRRAAPAAVVKQQLVEIRPLHLIRVFDGQVRIGGETKDRRLAVLVGKDLSTGLVYRHAPISSATPRRSNSGRFSGSSNSPMWKRGKRSFSSSTNSLALPRQQGCRRGPCRTAADHENVAFLDFLHGHSPQLFLRQTANGRAVSGATRRPAPLGTVRACASEPSDQRRVLLLLPMRASRSEAALSVPQVLCCARRHCGERAEAAGVARPEPFRGLRQC